MRTTFALSLALLVIGCGNGPSKADAKKLLDAYYADKTLYAPLAAGKADIPLTKEDSGKDVMEFLYARHMQGAQLKIATDLGLMAPKFVDCKMKDTFIGMQDFCMYELELTAKGKQYLKPGNPKYAMGMMLFRIGDQKAGEVTGVVVEKNEGKIYFKETFEKTTFYDAVLPTDRPANTDPHDMTAHIISDGKEWKVREIVAGTM